MSIIKIKGIVKDYEWGRTDQNALVYQFSKSQFKQQKYAELWMGTHFSSPSLLQNNNQTLIDYFKQNNIPNLKYLFKILSIKKCLSIQAHPNQQQSEQLNKKFPNIYPDPNSKPELFLTLTNFKCLMGFITDDKLKELLLVPPFTSLKSSTIKQLLIQISSLSKQQITHMVTDIVNSKHQFKGREEFIVKIQNQFPYDVGIIVSFLLEYHEFPPGYAYYIKAGQPHAYAEGECLELMKNSDIVVRLGLTPKLRDTQNLIKILDYDNRVIEALNKVNHVYQGGILKMYQIFEDSTVKLSDTAIGIVLQGNFEINKEEVKKGDIFVVLSGESIIKGKGKMYLATSD